MSHTAAHSTPPTSNAALKSTIPYQPAPITPSFSLRSAAAP